MPDCDDEWDIDFWDEENDELFDQPDKWTDYNDE